MDEQEAVAWNRLIDRVAHGICRDFPDSNVEDIQQTLWVEVLKAQAAHKWLSPDTQHVASGLWFAGKKAALLERKEHLTISPQYGYRTRDIRTLLENHFNREEWVDCWTPEDAESELGDVGLEMQSDLARAWRRLSRPHKVLLFVKFALKESVDSRKLSKALERMADILNSYQPQRRPNGPGRRTVISNAHAAYLISKTIEE